MTVTLAHIAGIPLEEGVLTFAPAAGAFAVLVGARLRGLARWPASRDVTAIDAPAAGGEQTRARYPDEEGYVERDGVRAF